MRMDEDSACKNLPQSLDRVLGSTNITVLAVLTDLLRRNYLTVQRVATEEGQVPREDMPAALPTDVGESGTTHKKKRHQNWDLKEWWKRQGEKEGGWGAERATVTNIKCSKSRNCKLLHLYSSASLQQLCEADFVIIPLLLWRTQRS